MVTGLHTYESYLEATFGPIRKSQENRDQKKFRIESIILTVTENRENSEDLGYTSTQLILTNIDEGENTHPQDCIQEMPSSS